MFVRFLLLHRKRECFYKGVDPHGQAPEKLNNKFPEASRDRSRERLPLGRAEGA